MGAIIKNGLKKILEPDAKVIPSRHVLKSITLCYICAPNKGMRVEYDFSIELFKVLQ